MIGATRGRGSPNPQRNRMIVSASTWTRLNRIPQAEQQRRKGLLRASRRAPPCWRLAESEVYEARRTCAPAPADLRRSERRLPHRVINRGRGAERENQPNLEFASTPREIDSRALWRVGVERCRFSRNLMTNVRVRRSLAARGAALSLLAGIAPRRPLSPSCNGVRKQPPRRQRPAGRRFRSS